MLTILTTREQQIYNFTSARNSGHAQLNQVRMSREYLQYDWHVCTETTGLEHTPYAIPLLGCHSNVSTHVAACVKARRDLHTGMAHMPTTHTAKRWHCTVLMGDNELQLCLKPETCTRTTRQRHSLNWHCGVQMRDSGATALPDARDLTGKGTS